MNNTLAWASGRTPGQNNQRSILRLSIKTKLLGKQPGIHGRGHFLP